MIVCLREILSEQINGIVPSAFSLVSSDEEKEENGENGGKSDDENDENQGAAMTYAGMLTTRPLVWCRWRPVATVAVLALRL